MVDPRQKKLLTEIMEADAKDGLYDDTNKMVTAVEWFYNELKRHKLIQLPLTKGPNVLFEQAKAMEKQQIIDANIAGMEFIPVDPSRYQQDAEQYYNETYK